MDDYYAAGATVLPLWGEDVAEEVTGFRPLLYVFAPAKASGKRLRTVLLCPGGGYGSVSLYREGLMWKDFFRSENVVLAVVRYRLPHGKHDVPKTDVFRAIRLLRDHAAEWGIDADDIGIMGFSAGGHLASTVALQAPDDLRPSFQILFYPVITMDGSVTHSGSRRNLLGDSPSPELVRAYSGELNVTAAAPRAFIATGSEDNMVPVINSARYFSALIDAGVKADMHTWPSSVHGFAIEHCMPWESNLLLELRDLLRSF